MFRCLAAALAAILMATTFAAAAWKPLARAIDRGYISVPSCANLADGTLLCGGRKYDGDIQWLKFSGGVWTRLNETTPYLSLTRPECVGSPSAGTPVNCVFNSGAGLLVVAGYDRSGDRFRLLSRFDRPVMSDIGCATVPDQRPGVPFCSYRNADGNLDNLVDGTRRPIHSAPSCTNDGDGNVVCVALGDKKNVLAFRYRGGLWRVADIGGTGTTLPTCTTLSLGDQVYCTVRGLDLKIWHTRFQGGDWNATRWLPWSPLSGEIAARPSCAGIGENAIACAVTGARDNAVYVYSFQGAWTPLASLGVGPGYVGEPSCTHLSPGRAVCMILGVDTRIYYTVGP